MKAHRTETPEKKLSEATNAQLFEEFLGEARTIAAEFIRSVRRKKNDYPHQR